MRNIKTISSFDSSTGNKHGAMETIQIKVKENPLFVDGYKINFKYRATCIGCILGIGNSIPEAIDDFLKINKLENTKFKWS